MSTPSTTPYDWLNTLPRGLLNVDEVPMVGHAAPFPWPKFVLGLVKLFELDKLIITPGEWKWRETAEVFSGISGDPFVMRFGVTGYDGSVTVAIDKRDYLALAYLLLLHRNVEAEILDPAHEQAMFYFLALAACDQLTNTGWEKGLRFSILPDASLSDEEPYLTFDLRVELTQRTIPVRIILDNAFRKSWKESHIAPFSPARNPQLAQKLEIPVSLEAGYIEMSADEWKDVRPGDFVALDSCTIDHLFQKGTVLLRAHQLPFFQAQLQDGNITLQEKPSYYEK